ncbi:type I 3-dehydroquinate dehydratase [Yersinia aleksiciae]|uniref:3-dehydroquinate dehydratase n=1 Tax=Yersinia aleksiciae TaxID=263819 RepID=A0ABM5UHC4_YERAE|nr:type I 3-dehydroquinate dehydratase [Yersinia aleksiciae]AKP35242.1 3-dehydroquinate dehydratase [Yersinia aleksiciae]CFQ38956.1 3-dehydroquinate dehydratase [Yersinia aleksiciae]
MKTVTVKNLVIGEGAPKIIVSLMGKDLPAIRSEALYYQGFDFDILEWRIDHFDDVKNIDSILEAARQLRSIILDKPILFTFRTAKEGGEKEISTKDYLSLNQTMIDSGQVDMIDLELFTGDQQVSAIIEHAHSKGVKVIMSNHDFHKTPAKEEIVQRLRKMQDLGADIPKIALMPQNKSDVVTLLAATLEMYEKYADRPIITMSMSTLGIISRLSGEVFGSAATFGALKKASAPGQIDIKELRSVLTILHQS